MVQAFQLSVETKTKKPDFTEYIYTMQWRTKYASLAASKKKKKILIFALHDSEWSTSRPSRLTSGER